ncbi:MAG: hypothetical protein V8T10_10110 [Merdibacter sp.]
MFCRGLKRHGATVLAIVDCPYDSLRRELREYIDDCYVVSSMENYDEMVRAMGYFTYRYGKIDWVESNNEYLAFARCPAASGLSHHDRHHHRSHRGLSVQIPHEAFLCAGRHSLCPWQSARQHR